MFSSLETWIHFLASFFYWFVNVITLHTYVFFPFHALSCIYCLLLCTCYIGVIFLFTCCKTHSVHNLRRFMKEIKMYENTKIRAQIAWRQLNFKKSNCHNLFATFNKRSNYLRRCKEPKNLFTYANNNALNLNFLSCMLYT